MCAVQSTQQAAHLRGHLGQAVRRARWYKVKTINKILCSTYQDFLLLVLALPFVGAHREVVLELRLDLLGICDLK